MSLSPDVGTTCSYTFVAPFTNLNGIYTLTRKHMFDDAVNAGVDIAEQFYVPAGVSTDVYALEWTKYQNDSILILTHVETQDIIAAPETALASLPDPMVKQYQEMYLAMPLGPIDDPDRVEWCKTQLRDIARSVVGATGDAMLMSTGSVWMTSAEYAALEVTRQQSIMTIKPLQTQVNEAVDQIQRLNDKIALMEDIIMRQNALLNPPS